MPLVLLLLLAVPALAQDPVPSRVELTGPLDDELEKRIRDAARLFTLADEPPATLVALERRAEADRERIADVLRAEGYYDGRVAITVGRVAITVGRAAVEVAVEPGPPTRLDSFAVEYRLPPGTPAPPPVSLDDLELDPGERARTETVLRAEKKTLALLAEHGYPLATIHDRQVIVDHATQAMRVTLTVDTGKLAHFGPVTVSGLEGLDEAWVRNRLPWREGERFAVSILEKLRKTLVESRLFSTIRLTPGTAVDERGALPLAIVLSEARPRSIGFGVDYSSSLGLSGEAFWEHRNLMGGGEALRAALTAGEPKTSLSLTYRGPDVQYPNQDLLAAAELRELRTEAFVTKSALASAGLGWHFAEVWSASVSLAAERTFEDQQDRHREFTLLSLPVELRQDSSDDLLDPTRGNRLFAQVQPFGITTPPFTRMEVYDTHYVELVPRPRLIGAGWVRAGTLQGAKAADVPADKRFYVGGPGSVRGFGYQMAGPVDDSGDPIGGRSAFAFGVELRAKVTDTIGIVPFIEGGRAYPTASPDVGQPLFWGAGLGFRYHTPFGPARADVAVPLNPRKGIDDPVQFTLSLGQAF
ncbi:MAG: outer membrane protein assembly factor [Magnetospirillum sp.]|nr:outer membrane protein assembly factor [Magnetospirillum sp.]